MVKIAVVGLGFMGKMHLSIYGQFDDVEVTALCDAHEEALKLGGPASETNIAVGDSSADVSGARRYTDFSRMLADGGFDFVDLCLPTHLHREYTVAALQAGYHVFCEKPMALTAEEGSDMIRASKKSGKLLTVGQCLRFWPMYVKLKEVIDSKQYGRVISGEFTRYSSTPLWSRDSWILDGSVSGNAALDMHIHDVDMIVHLFGRPRGVCAQGVKTMAEGFSHITTVYDYPDVAVNSVGNWVCSSGFGLAMRAFIVLEQAVVELDSTKQPMLTIIPDGGERIVPELDEKDGYYHELRSFADNVKTGSSPSVVTPESALESLEVTLAEINSAKKRSPVSL